MIKIFKSQSKSLLKLLTAFLIFNIISFILMLVVFLFLLFLFNLHPSHDIEEKENDIAWLWISGIFAITIITILIPIISIFRLKLKKRIKNDIIEINLNENSFKAISGKDIIICKISEIILCDYHDKTKKNKIEFELINGETAIIKIKQGILPLFEDYEKILPRIKWSISHYKQYL